PRHRRSDGVGADRLSANGGNDSSKARTKVERATAMRIALGADHRGYEMYQHLCAVLREAGHEVLETVENHNGEMCDYPDRAWPVARAVATGQADMGILICGTGIGMSIAANKVDGVRAALVHDEVS